MENEKNIAVPENIDATELAVAEEEAKSSTAVYTHRFNKPFVYAGKSYEELTFDWDALSGDDSLAIENEILALGKPLIAPEFSGEYLIRMASRACTTKIGTDVLKKMPMRDYNKIRSRARSFLLYSGS